MNEITFEEKVALQAQKLWREGIRDLHWSSAPLSKSHPWAESWADVYVAEICGPLELNWLATIAAPGDDMEEDQAYFQVEPDSSLWVEFGKGEIPTRVTLFSPGEDPLDISPDNGDSSECIDEQIKFYWSVYKQERFLEEDASCPTYRLPVWSQGLLSRVISDWLEVISGHRFSMHFDEVSHSPIDLEVTQAIEDIRSGRLQTFDLGDGLRISESALDFLLSDPEMAAEITAGIKKLLPPKDEQH